MSARRFPQAILVSCVVPWNEQEQFMEDSFRRQVAALRQNGFSHLYIFGTAGEGHAVDTPRYRQVVEVFYEATRGDNRHPQVGVIALSTANVIERIGIAHEIGFRMFQISLPTWGALNDREFFELGRTKQLEKLFAMAAAYARMSEEIFAPTGNRGLTDGAYDKILARLGGHDVPMRLLSPYEAFSEETCRECERIFQERYADWRS